MEERPFDNCSNFNILIDSNTNTYHWDLPTCHLCSCACRQTRLLSEHCILFAKKSFNRLTWLRVSVSVFPSAVSFWLSFCSSKARKDWDRNRCTAWGRWRRVERIEGESGGKHKMLYGDEVKLMRKWYHKGGSSLNKHEETLMALIFFFYLRIK